MSEGIEGQRGQQCFLPVMYIQSLNFLLILFFPKIPQALSDYLASEKPNSQFGLSLDFDWVKFNQLNLLQSKPYYFTFCNRFGFFLTSISIFHRLLKILFKDCTVFNSIHIPINFYELPLFIQTKTFSSHLSRC